MEAETRVRLSTFIEVEERVLAGEREQGRAQDKGSGSVPSHPTLFPKSLPGITSARLRSPHPPNALTVGPA